MNTYICIYVFIYGDSPLVKLQTSNIEPGCVGRGEDENMRGEAQKRINRLIQRFTQSLHLSHNL